MTQTQTAAVTFYPRNVVSRTTQLGVAHDLARRAGYDPRPGSAGRAAYEDRLEQLVGVRSLKRASREQRNTVVKALELELECQAFAEAVPLSRRPAPPELGEDELERIVNASSLEELWA